MTTARALLAAFRIPFLALTFVCVFLGVAVAVWTDAVIRGDAFVLVLLGALAAHVSVNTFNEYFDFRSGLDLQTVKTPWSGGSGALPAQPRAAEWVLAAAIAAAGVTVVCGLLLLQRAGLGLLPIGALGLVTIFTYTQWLTRVPLLSLIAPGLGFGLMVLGTYYVASHDYSAPAWAASAPVFFLVSNLLLLNQFPDLEADRRAGRRHYPIVLGRSGSAAILGVFYTLAYVVLAGSVWLGYLPAWSLLGLLTAPIAANVVLGARRCAQALPPLLPYLARNVVVVLLTPALIGAGLLIA